MNKRQSDREPGNRETQNRETKIEAAWRAALQPEQAPLGFASRVEERIQAQAASATRRKGWSVLQSDQVWLRIAIAAALLLAMVLPMGLRLHHQAQVAKGEAARDQVLLALRITGTQLRTIQHRTRYINTSLLEGESQ